ncbi:uncharacterized protein LOC103983193 [Musa acuminata AAA Group]|uniref:uncharacterized protein LOC103983193 n=1 Tax=Musa acuminata AAA Group TaxID=214697 RepID=UPI0031D0DFA8
MDIKETGDADLFKSYLQDYVKTISGCHHISIFLHFPRHEQSSQATSMREQLSYASAAACTNIHQWPDFRSSLYSISCVTLNQVIGKRRSHLNSCLPLVNLNKVPSSRMAWNRTGV